MNSNINIGVIGLWHLGCVICSAWTKLGFNVIGFDHNGRRIEDLNKGIPPIYEPGLRKSLQKAHGNELLSFSNNIRTLSNCNIIFISYDTPVLDDDSSDTTVLISSVIDASKIMKENAIIIISSQSPVGLCRYLRGILKKRDKSFDIAYSPENLKLGEAIKCYMNPGRIILGTANDISRSKCEKLFNYITKDIVTMDLESAEMVKHGINSFLATSITFANNLADICEYVGANILDVVKGMKSDSRIGTKSYLSPGIGFSGGTLGRDLKVLAKLNEDKLGPATLFEYIHDNNNNRKHSIVNKIKKMLSGISGRSLGILGLTYKPGTSTLRRSLPLEIVQLLSDMGALITVYDPRADYSELTNNATFKIANSIEEATRNRDLIVLLTEWPEFNDINWADISTNSQELIIFDTKNFLDSSRIIKNGIKYYSIGVLA